MNPRKNPWADGHTAPRADMPRAVHGTEQADFA
jgi:hypothetical protein